MYKRYMQGWMKHLDFMFFDVVSLWLAFILAVYIRHHMWAFNSVPYRNLGLTILLIDIVVLIANNTMHNVVPRALYAELIATLKHSFIWFAISMILLIATQTGDVFSRIILFLTLILYVVISYGIRLLWKRFLKRETGDSQKNRMLVVSTPEAAESILERLGGDQLRDFQIVGVVLTEEDNRAEIGGYPIVSGLADADEYICREWVDSVYIEAPFQDENIINLMDDCAQMGIPTHYHVPKLTHSGVKRFSEKVGGTTVLTTSISYATPEQIIIKRAMDIISGLIGSLIALIIIAIVGPMIKKASPGPILFTQERIGKNGKRFKMYKIRSMYMDAEERKKELLEQNRVKDGMMFKLDFDPRIIGNEILPDGTQKTGLGETLRRLSLDEFPQFFNVLAGQMSLIGTRPPTLDEWEKYELHHRARMAIKPGITGMWQVSGRSEITDFEEVVRLDTEYIANWSLGLDLMILFKTVTVVLGHRGAM